MGCKKAHTHVIAFLMTIYPEYSSVAVIPQISFRHYTRFYTNHILACLPYVNQELTSVVGNISQLWEARFHNTLDFHMDIYGILMNALRSKRSWKWWSQKNQAIFKDLIHSFADRNDALQAILTRLFYMYNTTRKRCHRRIRALWKVLLEQTDPHTMHVFVNKYIALLFIKSRTPIQTTWIPFPPVAFLLDFLRTYEDSIDLRSPVIDVRSLNTVITDDATVFSLISRFDRRNTSIDVFYSILKKRISSRLCTLASMSHVSNACWDALVMYFKTNTRLLYI
jgi:hypothetical protein